MERNFGMIVSCQWLNVNSGSKCYLYFLTICFPILCGKDPCFVPYSTVRTIRKDFPFWNERAAPPLRDQLDRSLAIGNEPEVLTLNCNTVWYSYFLHNSVPAIAYVPYRSGSCRFRSVADYVLAQHSFEFSQYALHTQALWWLLL